MVASTSCVLAMMAFEMDPATGVGQLRELEVVGHFLGCRPEVVRKTLRRLAERGFIVKSNGNRAGLHGKGVVYALAIPEAYAHVQALCPPYGQGCAPTLVEPWEVTGKRWFPPGMVALPSSVSEADWQWFEAEAKRIEVERLRRMRRKVS